MSARKLFPNTKFTDKAQTISASEQFLFRKKFDAYINNQWQPVSEIDREGIPCIDPATGVHFASISETPPSSIDQAVKAARAAFNSVEWKNITPMQRGELLWKLADRIEQKIEELAELETLDQGKPLSVSRYAEIPAAIKQLKYFGGAASKIEGNTIPTSISHQPPGQRMMAYTTKEPIGVVAVVIPWNSPFLLTMMKVAPALAAGCTLVIKPAEDTSLTALRLAELATEAGFPAGVVNVITGRGISVGGALASHEDVDKVAFTGSTATGRAIIDSAKTNMKKVSLELGGKSPTIVLSDANLDVAIKQIANGIFFNSGQVCVAGSRLYAHRSVFEQVVDGVCDIGKNLVIGSGLTPGVEIGPLVNATQLERVCGFIDRARDAGAEVRLGGESFDCKGYFMQPTVLTNVTQDMEIVSEEVFGPVLVCQPFDEVEEVVELANDSKYGLAATIWTENFSLAHRLAQDIRAGKLWINCHYMFDPSLPIGGMKESGWGRDNGMQALDNYLELKTVCACV